MLECFMSGGDLIKTITLRLDDDLHQELKLYSVKARETMQNIIICLIRKELEQAQQVEQK